MIDLARILRITGLEDEQLFSVFQYGSRVYGTATHSSDWDFIVVADSFMDGEEFRNGDYNIHVYRRETFQANLDDHAIHAMECFFSPAEFRIVDRVSWTFTLDRSKLRRQISAKASNSWVKSKKKLTVENGQEYIGVKSLFHALRIIDYGCQIAQHGGIIDFRHVNNHWWDIETHYQMMKQDAVFRWDFFKEVYQPIYNAASSEFRKLAEK